MSLEEAGIEHEIAQSAEEALEKVGAASPGFDLILLDIQLPGKLGWDLLYDLRERGDEIPIIFISALEQTSDRVKGLRMGADDYLVKPIEFEELLARIEAVLRRRSALEPVEVGDLKLDLVRRKAERAGEQTFLSPREFDLVLALASAKGAVVSRDKLLADVWDIHFDPGTNVLDVHIGRVRKKLHRLGRPMIKTVRGQGYKLIDPGTAADGDADEDGD